jgi:hypothetical protein
MTAATTRGRVMPIERFESSVWSIVQKRSGWDGRYPQSAKNVGLHAWHRTCIRDAYDNARSMVSMAGEIITDLKKHGAAFNLPGGATC